MIHALAHGVPVDVFGRKDATASQIQEAIAALQESGSIEYARSKAEEMVDRGKRALEVLPESDAREMLFDLADFMIMRRYFRSRIILPKSFSCMGEYR